MRFVTERAPWLLGAVFFALALHGLGATDIVGDDEAREAGIVQDMVAGHWLWPRFNDDLIPDKPVLYHWVAAIPCRLAGFSELAVRLPAALAAAGMVVWTAWFGGRVLGPTAGIAAGALVATFPAFVHRARVARPDTLVLLLLVAALGSAFLAWREGRRRDATCALVLLGLATLAKGPVAPVLFVATTGAFLFWQRDLAGVRRLVTTPGLAALLVLGLGWYALALAGWGEEFVHQHLVGRYLRNLAGGLAEGQPYSPKPLWYHATFYPLHLPIVALPWTPLVVAALVRLYRRHGFANPLVRFLVCWTLAPVVVFSPAEYKLRYYLLPCLPALALLAAPLAVELATRPILGRLRATRATLAAAVIILVAGGAAAWIALAQPDLLSRSDQATVATFLGAVPGGAATTAAVVGALLGMAATATALGQWGALMALAGALSLGWFAIGVPVTERRASAERSFRAFAEAVAEHYPAPAPVAFYGEVVRSVVVYARRPIPSLDRDARRIALGEGIIATPAAYLVLSHGGYLGPTLAVGQGRTGNLERGTLVLAEGTKAP